MYCLIFIILQHMQLLPHKTKQFLSLVIKIFIVIACCYGFTQKIMNNDALRWEVFIMKMNNSTIFKLKNIFLIFFVTFLNWFFEILKWQTLVASFQQISFFKASVQSLASLSVSLITPNRVGEYGAKSLYFEREHRLTIVSLNFLGNFHQLLTTLIFGSLGIVLLLSKHHDLTHVRDFLLPLFLVFTISFFLLLLLKQVRLVSNYFLKVKNIISNITVKTQLKILIYASIRYVLFSHQFYFLMTLFHIHISYVEAISLIALMYLISSIIPMLSLFDAVLKGSIAVWLFSFYKVDILSILSITSFMWLMNVVLPAMIGTYFVLTFKPVFTK